MSDMSPPGGAGGRRRLAGRTLLAAAPSAVTRKALEQSLERLLGDFPASVSGSAVWLAIEPTSLNGTLAPAAGAGSEAADMLVLYQERGVLRVAIDGVPAVIGPRLLEAAEAAGWAAPLLLEPHLQYDSRLEVGDMSASVIRLGFMSRRRDLTPGQFLEHWLYRHGPLVSSLAPRFVRYVTSVPRSSCPWDGIVEQWFSDEATWELHDRETANEKPQVLADIASFVGHIEQRAARPLLAVRAGSPDQRT
jgi:hypothetical protein